MPWSALARALLPFVLGAVVTAAGFAVYMWQGEGDAEITTSSAFIGFRRMDKLFTSFAHVPVIQITRGVSAGDAARGVVKEIFGQAEVPDLVVQGMCFREYEVGLGYADTLALFPKHLEAACGRRDEELPEPVILASNPVAGRVYGSYSQVECDREEMGRGSERPSWTLIKTQLARDRQWPRIVERSQRVLGSFLRIYCRDEAGS
jgi:2-hydroxychromene-2-carboxylate isomerase